MTVMIPRFFGLHQELVRSGALAQMKPGELRLYVYLMHESERFRTRKLVRTDAQFREIGLAPRTACNARKKLQERGFINYSATNGNRYSYTICDSTTGQPYPGDPKITVPYVKAAKIVNSRSEKHGLPGVFRS